MENGIYIATCRMYNSTRKLCVFNHSVKIYTPNGTFVALMTEEQAQENYGEFSSWKRERKENKLYNIAWMIEGHIKETIIVNATYPVVKWKMNQMKSQGYDSGLLMPVPSNLS